MIVLDANVLSELMRPRLDVRVMTWLASCPPFGTFTTAITQSEILYGLALLADGRRRDALEAAARAMFGQDFDGRVLPFDGVAAASLRRNCGSTSSCRQANIAIRRPNCTYRALTWCGGGYA